MKQFDMFTGYGGFTIACSNHGIQTIGFSEIDKYAIAVYKHHFPEVKEYGNARNIVPENIPDFDILTGGFPCQAFSIAGKRKGLEDTRGTLFYEIARIVSVKRPKLLLLENVRGLLSHDSGRTFGLILSTFSDLGYICEWQVLNSKDFGVPQNRERVFIIGHLGKVSGQTVFPIRESDKQFVTKQGQHSEAPIASTLQSPGHQCGNYKGMNMIQTLQTYYEYDENGNRKVYAKETDVYNEQHLEPRVDGMTNTLTSVEKDNMINEGQSIRRLTPIECERLMGLPDGWTSQGNFDGIVKDISDSQRYKLCGNGVVVNVVDKIIETIIQKEAL